MARPRRHPDWDALIEAQLHVVEQWEHEDIRAVGIGNRIRNKKAQPGPCLSVHVTRKRPTEEIASARVLPRSVKLTKGIRVPIDVLNFRSGFEEQSGAIGINDGVENGCVGCYIWREGRLYAVTAGHSVLGKDRRPDTADAVRRYTNDFKLVNFGTTYRVLFKAGLPADAIGRLDYAEVLVTAVPNGLLSSLEGHRYWSPNAPPDLARVRNKEVYAESYIPPYVRRARVAEVRHYLVDSNRLMDLRITGNAVSRKGDSGKIWRLASGMPLALHLAGNETPSGNSTVAFASFLYTVVQDTREVLLPE